MRYVYRKFTVFLIISAITISSVSGCAHKANTQAVAIPPSSEIAKKEAAPTAHNVDTLDTSGKSEGTVHADSVETTGAGGQHDAVVGAGVQAALEVIYFNFDSAALSSDARETLVRNFRQLSVDDKVNVQIEGHCDERGSGDYNLALGEKRADAVRKYLTSLGVSEERLSTISYGKEKPAVQGGDESAWAKNRRAEFVIQK